MSVFMAVLAAQYYSVFKSDSEYSKITLDFQVYIDYEVHCFSTLGYKSA